MNFQSIRYVVEDIFIFFSISASGSVSVLISHSFLFYYLESHSLNHSQSHIDQYLFCQLIFVRNVWYDYVFKYTGTKLHFFMFIKVLVNAVFLSWIPYFYKFTIFIVKLKYRRKVHFLFISLPTLIPLYLPSERWYHLSLFNFFIPIFVYLETNKQKTIKVLTLYYYFFHPN